MSFSVLDVVNVPGTAVSYKMPPCSPLPKKQRTKEDIYSSFLGCTVSQVSGHMLKGYSSTLQATLSVFDDLVNNILKVLVTVKVVNKNTIQGM
jgi:hypothetical protein